MNPSSELLSLLIPFMTFAFSMSATPGPNNMMLTASGANHGFQRTLPHMLGITVGCMALMSAVAMGLGALFQQWPQLQLLLKATGCIYLLWLAWKIARAPAPDAHGSKVSRPFTFWQAAAFQFANPKAWIMAISGVASFTLSGDQFLLSALTVVLLMGLVNLPSIALWAGFGVALGRLLRSARHWRLFNLCMGGLTASCVAMILL